MKTVLVFTVVFLIDMAGLMLALLRTMNYDVALVTMPGHMAAGIACADCEDKQFAFNGQNYFFVETTGPDNPIGYEADELKIREPRLYQVPQSAFYGPRSDGSLAHSTPKNSAPADYKTNSGEGPGNHQGYGEHFAGKKTDTNVSHEKVIKICEMNICETIN